MNATMRIHVVVSQGQTRANNAFGGICDLDVLEEKLVDGA